MGVNLQIGFPIYGVMKKTIGRKINAKGNGYAWIGGKLHLGVVDGDIPITVIYTHASVHDAQVAIPVINETTKRVDYLGVMKNTSS